MQRYVSVGLLLLILFRIVCSACLLIETISGSGEGSISAGISELEKLAIPMICWRSDILICKGKPKSFGEDSEKNRNRRLLLLIWHVLCYSEVLHAEGGFR